MSFISFLEKTASFLDKANNKLDELEKNKKEKELSEKKIIYTCKDVERFASNFKFNINKDCCPGNIIYFTDSNSRYEFLCDIDKMNDFILEATRKFKIRGDYRICVDEITFTGENASYIEVSPYTPSGKIAKYPITVFYRTPNYALFDAKDNYFGELNYCEDGSIGKARLINWIGNNGLFIYVKSIGSSLVLSKVEITDKGNKKVIYNRNKE